MSFRNRSALRDAQPATRVHAIRRPTCFHSVPWISVLLAGHSAIPGEPLSGHTLRSKSFLHAQIALLVWSTLSVAVYTIYFIVMAARPDWEDPGAACSFFVSGSSMPTNSSSSTSFSAKYITPFCILALERISTGAEIILVLVDLVVVCITSVVVNQLRVKRAQREEMARLEKVANQELPESVMLPSKFSRLTKKDSENRQISVRRNGTARVFFTFLMFGMGSLSPTPLSMPGFILVLIELILWTVDYGSHKDSQGKLSGGAKVGGGNFNAPHTFLVQFRLYTGER